MRKSFYSFKLMAAAALVLTVLVFVPVSNAQETEVDFEFRQPTHAIGITNLDVDGTLYDVDFLSVVSALEVYGLPPGEFDFKTDASAQAAVIAVNDELNQFFAATVGSKGAWQLPAIYNQVYHVAWIYTGGDDPSVHRGSIRSSADWEDSPDSFDGNTPFTWAIFTPVEPVQEVTIGGSVFFLGGSGLVLQLNGGDDETVDPVAGAPVPFTFDTPLAVGTTYHVTVAMQPSNPAQTCFVSRGIDTVPTEDVTNVLVYCYPAAWLPEVSVFVTSTTYDGNLGGVTGADAKCQAAAEAAELSGRTWTAWISDETEDAIDRIPDGLYRLLDDTLVALDKDDLVTANDPLLAPELRIYLRNAININEFGDPQEGTAWTGTDEEGGIGTGEYCNNWLSNAGAPTYGTLGNSSETSKKWTNLATSICDTELALYCFGEPTPAEPVTIGGTVSGLGAGGVLVLQNNGADDLTRTVDGPFTFATPLAPGTTYHVTVLTHPEGQGCTVANGSDMVPDTNVTGVEVTCLSGVTVPNVVELPLLEAVEQITAAGLKMGQFTTAFSATVPAGSVISQDPAADETVDQGSPVNLVVSWGRRP